MMLCTGPASRVLVSLPCTPRPPCPAPPPAQRPPTEHCSSCTGPAHRALVSLPHTVPARPPCTACTARPSPTPAVLHGGDPAEQGRAPAGGCRWRSWRGSPCPRRTSPPSPPCWPGEGPVRKGSPESRAGGPLCDDLKQGSNSGRIVVKQRGGQPPPLLIFGGRQRRHGGAGRPEE